MPSTTAVCVQEHAEASIPELTPTFMVRNLNGSANALLIIDDPFAEDDAEDNALLLVGTSVGSLYLYDVVAKKTLGLVYRKCTNVEPRRTHHFRCRG